MIPFFRKIRKQLADDKQILRYGRYAIGEIALVVIGILIALRINNWNEFRKERSVELNALKDLRTEFRANENLIRNSVARERSAFESNEAFIRSIRDHRITTESLVRRMGGSVINPNNGVLNSLIATGTINTIRNDSLKFLLTSWSDIIQNYREEQERHYNWLDVIVWPYLNEIIPNSDYSKAEEWEFLDSIEVFQYYDRAFRDLKFRNFHLENRKALEFVIGESEQVTQNLERILDLLESEIGDR